MHAIVVRVSIGDHEVAQKALREQIVPRISSAPGFVAGYWTRSSDGSNGLSMLVFDSEENARAGVEQIGSGPMPETVTLESTEIREVVANA
jgi:hypothetical protein